MKSWLNVSITGVISSLSFILLSFLFIVILYSVYQLQQISQEMQEVAEVDIPLNEVIADVELVQLKQHLLMETMRQQGAHFFSDEAIKTTTLANLDEYNVQLGALLDKATNTVQSSLKLNRIRIEMADHQKVLALIRVMHVHRKHFNTLVERFFEQDAQSFLAHWQALESQDDQLDVQADELLKSMDKITSEVSIHVEKQEQRFLVVNAVLGISALFIGIYLTIFVIQYFRHRVASVRGQIEFLYRSINATEQNDRYAKFGHVDELGGLEKDLQLLVGQFSQEMNDRHEAEKKLIELATRDKLTGVFNRHKWDDQLQMALALAKQGCSFGLILMDVDYFKKINDSHGHDMGDKVLQCLVLEVQKHLSESDMLFRIGGEEFVVLVQDTDEQGTKKLAELLRVKIAALNEPGIPQLTMSFGVTCYKMGDDRKSIVKRADMLLYEAKGAGRNSVKVG